MNIAFDIDGVLTDFENFLNVFGNKHFNVRKGYSNVHIQASSDISERFGCSEKMKFRFWAKYLFWYARNYPIRENAAEVIRTLHSKGHKIYIVTGRALCSYHIIGYFMRCIVKMWLKENRVEYDDIYFVSTNKSSEEKCAVCRELKIDLVIEDSPQNIEGLKKECPCVICMDADYNRQCFDVIRAYTFFDILEIVSAGVPKEIKSISEFCNMLVNERIEYIKDLQKYYKRLPFDREFLYTYKLKLRKYILIIGSGIKRVNRIQVEGGSNIPSKKGVIFISNHRRSFDIPLLYTILEDRYPRFLIKHEYEFSKYGFIQRKIGTIFVNRKSKESRKIASSTMIHHVINGEDVLLFPEGTRNRINESLLSFKRGAVYVAQVTGAPIVPIIIKENGKRNYNVVIGECVWVNIEDSLQKKCENIRQIMIEHYMKMK